MPHPEAKVISRGRFGGLLGVRWRGSIFSLRFVSFIACSSAQFPLRGTRYLRMLFIVYLSLFLYRLYGDTKRGKCVSITGNAVAEVCRELYIFYLKLSFENYIVISM